MSSNTWESNEELQYFREYLRIPSVHPNPDYEPCLEFLRKQAKLLELPIVVHYPIDEKAPVAVLTWQGLEPELPSVLLNSHMDVVAVYPENWTHPPFAADIDEKGRIFGRGSQDMKCVGMQYLAAIRALKRNGVRLKRTIHISFVADEETGGQLGMAPFVDSADFRNLNIGFSLDEGMASPTAEIPVYYAERTGRCVTFKISGQAGHGSLLLSNTAGEKMNYILGKMMDFRRSQVERLEQNPQLTVGDVTTINLNAISGGVQSNVVPPMLSLFFDCRVALDVNLEQFEADLLRWAEEAGGGVEVEFMPWHRRPHTAPTVTNESNPFWMTFKNSIDELQVTYCL
ncbi:aminoacylase-1-like [Drosophila tropicalis]|uniref:aminoacylase-1-like n=1 Tax=Drosophila tropicalis TaxID=46794 RepID=UPI0035AB813C